MQTDAQKISAWIEDNIGTVLSCESQNRWRDAWFVTAKRGQDTIDLYVRGDRNEEFPPEPLEYEAAIFEALGHGGIPVPKIYGICSDPHAIVMENAAGRANLQTAQDEAERVSVLEHLGEIMADMHSLDLAPFVAAGARIPETSREANLPYVTPCAELYRRHAVERDPRVEFLLRWLDQHLPDLPRKVAIVQQDSGQFLFDNGRITAMVDMELACIADPLIDIAALRQRAVAEPMGDLRPLLRRYAQRSGVVLDRQRITYHTISWMTGTCAIMAPSLSAPKPETNYPEYLSWYMGCLMSALSGIAEYAGYRLNDTAPPAPATPSRWGAVTSQLRTRTGPGQGRDDYHHQLNDKLCRFAGNLDSMAAWAEAAYIKDVAALTDSTPGDWKDADKLFLMFIEQAGTDQDERIVDVIHRWVLRQKSLIEGLYAMPIGQVMPIDELLDF